MKTKDFKIKIPKGYRRVRTGEILPNNYLVIAGLGRNRDNYFISGGESGTRNDKMANWLLRIVKREN